MVKRKEATPDATSLYEAADQWLARMKTRNIEGGYNLIQTSMDYAKLLGANLYTPTGENVLQLGLEMVYLLENLNLSSSALAAALMLFTVQCADINAEELSKQLGPEVSHLLIGVRGMDTIGSWYQHHKDYDRQHNYMDNLRKMLLALVDQVDMVLIKLAEQVLVLRMAKHLPNEQQAALARLVSDIYAPLANRLGIGQLKWELEDLAFRYLNPAQYQELAKTIEGRRSDREQYVEQMKTLLRAQLLEGGAHIIEITGRVKHIYSIYRKMVRKNVPLDQIYDAIALRILTPDIEACYAALSIVHQAWEQIPAEFDDYVSKPKPNGYRSIHTAIVGPGGRNVEIQIRTQQMHEESELGFAAHWKYKEGANVEAQFETKINWLRQLLEWQQELAGEEGKTSEKADLKALFQDRVYVFSPKGDIVDLPTHATPLDFAYQIHTQIGHRCRGAKINGSIVPLTYQLKTGDRVEILTQKQPNPSRDWLNTHSGYLATARARAKVFHWFKQQDYERYVEEGRTLFERELKQHHFTPVEFSKLARKLHYKQVDDFFAALGNGDLKLAHAISVMQGLQPSSTPLDHDLERSLPHDAAKTERQAGVSLQGVEHLLSKPAQCCKPIPGDKVIGFITRGRGISIHRQDCPNILTTHEPERLMPIDWEHEQSSRFLADLTVWAEDRDGLLRDITSVLSSHKTKLMGIQSMRGKNAFEVAVKLTLELQNVAEVGPLQALLQQVPGVIHVQRKF